MLHQKTGEPEFGDREIEKMMHPDFKSWTSLVLDGTAFVSVSIWALRGLVRDVKTVLVEVRKQTLNDIKPMDDPSP
jgi:hypothetical protein